MNDEFNNNTSDSTYSYSYVNQNQNTETNAQQETAQQETAQEQTNSWEAQSQQLEEARREQEAQRAMYTQYEAPEKKKRFARREKRAKQPGGNGGHTSFATKMAKCIAIALVFGLVAGSAFAGTNYFWGDVLGTNDTKVASTTETGSTLNRSDTVATTNTAAGTSTTTATDVSQIAESVMPSIVAITNMSEQQVQNWFGQSQTYESESAGSGIIVSQDDDYLYIATNNHVVSGSTSLTVQFTDDSTVSGEIKGTDESNDLAVVAVKLSDVSADTLAAIKVATIGSSSELVVGEGAVAIGNALGYGQSVTTGIISAVDREVSVSDENTGTSTSNKLIQTDAAINPGNSGGALLNMKGEVIGINSVKYSDTSVEGMGYAIPIDTASPIIEKLINNEVVDEADAAYLGIQGVEVSDSVAQTYNMPVGVYVYQVVEGSPVAQSGLAQGDIITAFNGTSIASMSELENQLQYCAAGDQAELTIQRLSNDQSGQYTEQTITVTLGKKNN